MSDDAQDFVDATPDHVVTGRESNGQFKGGVSGNPEGRPRSAFMKRAMMNYLESNPEALAQIVSRVFDKALGSHDNRFGEVVGDLEAAGFIRDTVDGKPKQAVEVSGADEGPMVMKIIHEDM